MQDAVVAEQPLRLARGGGGDSGAVGVDVVGDRGVRVQDDVVQDFRHIANKPGADFGQHSDYAVLFQRETIGNLPHKLVGGEGCLAGSQRGRGRGAVFGAGIEVDIPKLARHVKRV